MSDEDGWDISDDDLDEFLDAWDEVDQEAAAYLEEHLPDTGEAPGPDLARATRALRDGVESGGWPFDYFVHALAWTRGVPAGQEAPWLAALAATISPPHDPQTDIEQQSAVMALEHADWLGMVIGMVRRGVGAELSADLVQGDVEALEDIEGDIEDPDGHLSVLETAVLALSPLWQGLGVVDEDERLTALGRWGLPRALHQTWVGADLGDAGQADDV